MSESLFTFRVQLHVDDVSHNRRVVERLHGHLGCFHGLKNNFGYSQVLFVLRIVQDLHLLDFSIFLAHVGKKSFPDVVVESGECHLLWRHGADITLIDLGGEGQELMLRAFGLMLHHVGSFVTAEIRRLEVEKVAVSMLMPSALLLRQLKVQKSKHALEKSYFGLR